MNPMTTRFTVKFWTYLLTGFGVGLLFNVLGVVGDRRLSPPLLRRSLPDRPLHRHRQGHAMTNNPPKIPNITIAARHSDYLVERLARKLVYRELAYQEVNVADYTLPASQRRRNRVTDVAAADAAADAVADTVITVFDLPLTPFGLRQAVRTFIEHAGPRPPLGTSDFAAWNRQVEGEVATTLKGG